MDDTVVQRLRIIGDLQAEEGVYEREETRLRRQRTRFAERIRKFSRHMSERHRDEGEELIQKDYGGDHAPGSQADARA